MASESASLRDFLRKSQMSLWCRSGVGGVCSTPNMITPQAKTITIPAASELARRIAQRRQELTALRKLYRLAKAASDATEAQDNKEDGAEGSDA